MKHSLRLLTLLLALFSFSFLQAQSFGGLGGGVGASSITGKIAGQIIDSLTKAPVEFATIVLIDIQTEKEVGGIITDGAGIFKLSDVKLGKYKLSISFIGYATKTLEEVELSKRKPDVDLGKLFLQSDNVMLQTVEVVEQASVFENKIDKIVYNVEKDATVTGGDASDVLRNAPLVSVDLEGNVSLRGSQNITILINGRPSGMFASSVRDALKSIPADQIKSVEVVTTPTAKYDGEGSAGIINIITKKKTAEGFTGSINTSVGNNQNNAVLNLSASKGRFGVSGSGSTFFSWYRPSFFSFYRESTFDDVKQIQKQNGDGRSQFIGFNSSINAFYDINAFHSITSTFRINGRQFNRDGTNSIVFSNPIANLQQQYESLYDTKNLNSGFDWVTDYKIKFDEKGHDLTFAYQLTQNVDDRENDILQRDLIGNDPFINASELRNNDGTNLESIIQADYVQPFNDKIKLEIGAKGVIRRIVTDYNVFDRQNNTFINDPFQSNIFNYNQDVYAGYASFNLKLGKNYGLVAGARYEYTDISGSFDRENPPFAQDYANLLPSIIFSRNFKNFQSVKLSYSRRIQRPSLFYVNPYSDQTDNRNQTFGNPLLAPEVTDQVELGYNTFIKGVGVNGAFYYRRTTDIIESFLQTVTPEGISQTSFRNIGENNSFGTNVFTSLTIKRVFTLRGSFNVYTYNATANIGGEELSANAILWNGFGSASYDVKKIGLKIEAFGFAQSPRQTIQGVVPAFSIFGMGIRQDVLKKKGSVGIRLIEPFAKFKNFGTELEGSNFYLKSDFSVLFRSVGVSFQYQFGSMNFQARERRSTIKNNDQKAGENPQQQGGGGI